MEWIKLNDISQLDEINEVSFSKPVIIFKHSTRCNISATALARLERKNDDSFRADFYFLDLVQHRNISNRIAEIYGVIHQSPQILLIKNGECIYEATHLEIDYMELATIL